MLVAKTEKKKEHVLGSDAWVEIVSTAVRVRC